MAKDGMTGRADADSEHPASKLHVNSFYGSSKVVDKDVLESTGASTSQMLNSIDKCKTLPGRQLERSSLKITTDAESRTQYKFCKKLVQKKTWHHKHKHSSCLVDRKPKSVERHVGVKIKRAVNGRPLTSTRQYQMVVNRPETELKQSESGEKHPVVDSNKGVRAEKENKNNNIKRFFKHRTNHIRNHVTSVDGKFISMENLSGSSPRNKPSLTVKHGLAADSHLKASTNDRTVIDVTFNDHLVPVSEPKSPQVKTDEPIITSCLADESEWHSITGLGMPSKVFEYDKDSKNESCSSSTNSPKSQTLLFSPGSRTSGTSPCFSPAQSSVVAVSPTLTMKRKCDVAQPRSAAKKDKKEQMILDFGQKLHGTVTCTTCGMTYSRRHPDDELTHSRHHRDLFRALQFTGKSRTRVVQDFPDGSYVIVVTADDRRMYKRVEEIKKIVDAELGFVMESMPSTYNKTFLYVNQTQVVGFCRAQPISQGYRVQTSGESTQTPCCSEEPVPVRCGISRIWVLASHRRKGIASHLVDVVRANFVMGYPLKVDEIAFSDPTLDGAKFAATYSGTSNFLVYGNRITS